MSVILPRPRLGFSLAFVALLGGASILSAAAASAADTDAPRAAPTDASGVEEILVTARRRVENQQDVPYSLLNLRAGFRADNGLEVSVWSNNVTDENYMLLEQPQPGNSGLVVGVPGDPRMSGLTVRYQYN